MNKQTEALKMAIEAVEFQAFGEYRQEVVAKLKEALAEAEKQEPVALIRHENGNFSHAPSWQSLSDDEIWDIANFLGKNKECDYPVIFAKTIDKALKEKNKC